MTRVPSRRTMCGARGDRGGPSCSVLLVIVAARSRIRIRLIVTRSASTQLPAFAAIDHMSTFATPTPPVRSDNARATTR